MGTFCTEGLVMSKNITIYFKPQYKPTSIPKTYTFIFFFNVRLGTEEKDMNKLIKQYDDLLGVHYPTQEIVYITDHTGTRVYLCTRIKEHFPKAVHIFER